MEPTIREGWVQQRQAGGGGTWLKRWSDLSPSRHRSLIPAGWWCARRASRSPPRLRYASSRNVGALIALVGEAWELDDVGADRNHDLDAQEGQVGQGGARSTYPSVLTVFSHQYCFEIGLPALGELVFDAEKREDLNAWLESLGHAPVLSPSASSSNLGLSGQRKCASTPPSSSLLLPPCRSFPLLLAP